jgi:hypothetical protein
MEIWIPESLYGMFPFLIICCGLAFPFSTLGKTSYLLGCALVVYGIEVLKKRLKFQW